MRTLTRWATLLGLVTGLALGSPVAGRATVGLQNQAKELGYPSNDCSYCHTFGRAHMKKHAQEAALQSTNCVTCHGRQLPLDGVELYNERGRFLLGEKKARKAERVDMRWLEGYVEKPAATPSPTRPPD